MDQKGDYMKMNFDYFHNVINRAEKVDEKNGVLCLVSMFPSWIMVIKLSKKCIFWNFVVTSARNLSLLKQFRYKHLNVFITLFQKMVWFVGDWGIFYDVLAIKISKKMPNQQKLNLTKYFDFKRSKTVSHSIISNATFWKCVTRPFRCIYVNCFDRLRFLAEVSTKLQKMHFFRQFKDYKSGREHGN